MTSSTPLLAAWSAGQWRALRGHARIDHARLLGVRTEHALTQIAYLGLQHVDLAAQTGNLGLVLGHSRPGLGQLVLVPQFNPLGALSRPFVHPAPVAGIVAQLNILSARHPDIGRPRKRSWRRCLTLNR